jgi:centromere protein C
VRLEHNANRLTVSAPDPAEAFSTRKLLRSTKTSLPPPSARSPFKTNIGSSPRRRRSSVAPAVSRSVKRKLEFRADEPRQSIEQADIPIDPQLSDSRRSTSDKTHPASSSGSRKRLREEVYVEDEEVELPIEADESFAFVNGDANGYEDDFRAPSVELEAVNSQPNSSPMLRKKKKARNSLTEQEAEAAEHIQLPRSTPRKTYPSPRHAEPVPPFIEDYEPLPEPSPEPPPSTTKKRAPSTKKNQPGSMLPPALPASRARSTTYATESETTGDEYQAPKKRPVGRPAKKGKAPAKSKGKAPLAPKDVNTSAPRQNGNGNLWKQTSRKPPAAAKLAITQREATVEPLITTRSGRRTVAPIAHWRADEKIHYGWDGEIVDVHRAEDDLAMQLPTRVKSRAKSRAKSQSKELGGASRGEEVEMEQWEKNEEVLVGNVCGWDNENAQILDEEYQAGMFYIHLSILYEHLLNLQQNSPTAQSLCLPKTLSAQTSATVKSSTCPFSAQESLNCRSEDLNGRRMREKIIWCFSCRGGKWM